MFLKLLKVGSTKDHLQKTAIEIFNECIRNNIKLYSEWIPREMNSFADQLSKIKDTVYWNIDNETFELIESKFGVFTYDRFASDLNARTIKFNSKFYCPNSFGVNAFAYDWKHELNWLCPPINLISKALSHIELCRAKGGFLFVPFWPSAYFWPLLTADGQHFQIFVKKYLLLDPFYSCNDTDSIFNGFTKFNALALMIDFS